MRTATYAVPAAVPDIVGLSDVTFKLLVMFAVAFVEEFAAVVLNVLVAVTVVPSTPLHVK